MPTISKRATVILHGGGFVMKQVYNECTCCYKELTKEELKKNEEKENLYYTICNDCLHKATERIIKIANQTN